MAKWLEHIRLQFPITEKRIVESREGEERRGEEMLGLNGSSMGADYLYCRVELLKVRKRGSSCGAE